MKTRNEETIVRILQIADEDVTITGCRSGSLTRKAEL